MTEKEFEPDDPMELVGMALPEGDLEQTAECIVEEYIRDGWDDASLLRLFRDPFYRFTHRIHQQKGETYVVALVTSLRQKWGIWKGDPSLRLRMDEVKKRMLEEVKGDA
ncbi:MAG: hypothetical protein HY652_11765 [Acidobacteria bacterium]|nr:hypothetical protein [Acidobacteriota bacterium]